MFFFCGPNQATSKFLCARVSELSEGPTGESESQTEFVGRQTGSETGSVRFQTGSEEGASRAPPCAAAGAQTTGGSVRIPRSTRANFQAARPPVARSPADLPADPVAIRIAPSASGGGQRPATPLEAVRVADARKNVRSGRLDQFSRSAETWRARTAIRREARD